MKQQVSKRNKMKTTINTTISFLKKVTLISIISSVVFAIGVNDEIELSQLMNARYSANFTRHANNLKGQLAAGSKAKVIEVKKFSSGNSGFLVEVKSVPPARAGRTQLGAGLVGQKVWVYYNAKKPTLKLFNAGQRQVRNPDDATDATTIKDVPVILDPAAPPAPVVAASADSSAASSDPSLIPINPAVSGTGTVSGTAIPDLVGAANGAVGGTGGGNSGCRDCSNPAPVGGSGNSGGPTDTVSGTTGVSPAPVAPGTIPAGVSLSISEDLKVTAKVKCSYPASYGSHAGSWTVAIENNRVTYLDATIDNGRCRISSETFKQVEMGNNSIVMKDQYGCTATIGTIIKGRRPDGTLTGSPVTAANRDQARLTFGLVQISGGPCQRLCNKVQEGRGFWQVETNPSTGTCE